MCWSISGVLWFWDGEVISTEMNEQYIHSLMIKIYFLSSLLPGLNTNAFKELAQCWTLGQMFHVCKLLLCYAYYAIQHNSNAGKHFFHLKKSPGKQQHMEAFQLQKSRARCTPVAPSPPALQFPCVPVTFSPQPQALSFLTLQCIYSECSGGSRSLFATSTFFHRKLS